jgi:hypothetical protein
MQRGPVMSAFRFGFYTAAAAAVGILSASCAEADVQIRDLWTSPRLQEVVAEIENRDGQEDALMSVRTSIAEAELVVCGKALAIDDRRCTQRPLPLSVERVARPYAFYVNLLRRTVDTRTAAPFR